MNFVLAAVLFSIVFMSGFPTDVSGVPADKIPAGAHTYIQVSDVAKDSPAEQAGIMPMDKILKAGDSDVKDVEDVQNYTKENSGKNITLTIDRQGSVLQKTVLARTSEPSGQGAIGVSLAKTAVIHYSFLESIREGFLYTVNMTVAIFEYLFHIVSQLLTTGGTSAQVSGPVGMVSMTQQAARLGLMVLLNFTALISVNLAIINILPLPALDGGRIFFLLVEKLKGSPVSQELEAKIHNAGFMALMLLMVIVTFQDIMRLGVWNKIAGMF
jgi:regulator of sigma E protease